MNPICSLIELTCWRDVLEAHLQEFVREDERSFRRIGCCGVEVLQWVEGKLCQSYEALARKFVHPVDVESSHAVVTGVSKEFSQVIRDSVVGPLGRICKTLPNDTKAQLRGVETLYTAGSGGRLSSVVCDGNTLLDAGPRHTRNGGMCSCSAAWWEWTDFFTNMDLNAADEGELKGACAVAPSFRQWNASTLAALQSVGSLIVEVQNDLVSAVGLLGQKHFGRVMDETSGKKHGSLWLEFVFMLEDAFEVVVKGVIEFILWGVHQCLLEDGVFAGRPLFSLNAVWQDRDRCATLDPTPAEVHERLMSCMRKELIWNVVPEFNLSQIVLRQASGAPHARKASLRNRLMEEGQVKRMWDSIHFALNQRCDEVQDSLQAGMRALAFCFLDESEYHHVTPQQLREIRGRARGSLLDSSRSVRQGAFVVCWDSVHRVVVDRLETTLRNAEEEISCADILSRGKMTAARVKELGMETDSDSSSRSLSALLNAFHQRGNVEGKYHNGLDPLVHTTHLINEQKQSEKDVLSQFTVLSRGGLDVIDEDTVRRTTVVAKEAVSMRVVSAGTTPVAFMHVDSPEYDHVLHHPFLLSTGVSKQGVSEGRELSRPLTQFCTPDTRSGKQGNKKEAETSVEPEVSATSSKRTASRRQNGNGASPTMCDNGPDCGVSGEQFGPSGPAAVHPMLTSPTNGLGCAPLSRDGDAEHLPPRECDSLTDKLNRTVYKTNTNIPAPVAPSGFDSNNQTHVVSASGVVKRTVQQVGTNGREKGSHVSTGQPPSASGGFVSTSEGYDAVSAVHRRTSTDSAGKRYQQESSLLPHDSSSIEALKDRVRAFKESLPFLSSMPTEGVYLEDIDLSDSCLQAAVNRLFVLRRDSATNNCKEVAAAEDDVSSVVESLASGLSTVTLSMHSRFPFLERRICGVLLGNLQVLEVDEEFQWLMALYNLSQQESGLTGSIEQCLRVRAQTLAKEWPRAVIVERCGGQKLECREDIGNDFAERLRSGNYKQVKLRDRVEVSPGPHLEGCIRNLRPELSPFVRQPEVQKSAMPSPHPPSVEAAPTSVNSCRFVRSVLVQGWPEDKTATALSPLVDQAAVLPPGISASIEHRRGCYGAQSAMNDGCIEKNTFNERCAQANKTVPSTLGGHTPGGVKVQLSHLHPLEPVRSSLSSLTAAGSRRQPSSAPLPKSRQEPMLPGADSHAGEIVRGVEGLKQCERLKIRDAALSQAVANDSLEGCRCTRNHGQDRQVPANGYNSVVGTAKYEVQEFRPLNSAFVSHCGPPVHHAASCVSPPLQTLLFADKVVTPPLSKWDRSRPSLPQRFGGGSSMACLPAAVSTNGAAADRNSFHTALPRDGKRDDIGAAGRSAGSEETGNHERDAADAPGDQGKRESQRQDPSEAGVKYNHAMSRCSNTVGGPMTEKLLGNGSGTLVGSTGVVETPSSGTRNCERQPERIDKSFLPVLSSKRCAELNEATRRPASEQSDEARGGCLTSASSCLSSQPVPCCSRSPYFSGEPCKDVSSPFFPPLSPARTSDSPLRHTDELVAVGPVTPSIGLRQHYIDCCRRACIKPNSLLARLLPEDPGIFISRVDTSMNYIGPKGLHPIMEVLRLNSGLQHLNLSDNNVANDEVVKLVRVLLTECGASLNFLDLSNNPISLAGGAALLRLARNRPLLKTVHVRGTLIPFNICCNIQEACKANAAAILE